MADQARFDNYKLAFELRKRYKTGKARIGITEVQWAEVYDALAGRMAELDVAYRNVRIAAPNANLAVLEAYNQIIVNSVGADKVGVGKAAVLTFDFGTSPVYFATLQEGLGLMTQGRYQRDERGPRMTDDQKRGQCINFMEAAEAGFLDNSMITARPGKNCRLRAWSEVNTPAGNPLRDNLITRTNVIADVPLRTLIVAALNEPLNQGNRQAMAGYTKMTYAVNTMIPCIRAGLTRENWLALVSSIGTLSNSRPEGLKLDRMIATHPLFIRISGHFEPNLDLYAHPHRYSRKRFISNAIITAGGCSLNAVVLRQANTNQILELIHNYKNIMGQDETVKYCIHLFLLYDPVNLSKTRTGNHISIQDVEIRIAAQPPAANT